MCRRIKVRCSTNRYLIVEGSCLNGRFKLFMPLRVGHEWLIHRSVVVDHSMPSNRHLSSKSKDWRLKIRIAISHTSLKQGMSALRVFDIWKQLSIFASFLSSRCDSAPSQRIEQLNRCSFQRLEMPCKKSSRCERLCSFCLINRPNVAPVSCHPLNRSTFERRASIHPVPYTASHRKDNL